MLVISGLIQVMPVGLPDITTVNEEELKIDTSFDK